MQTELNKCSTPWCKSSTVHTTTFHGYKKGADGEPIQTIEVEHSCTSCHVRTPRMTRDLADLTWNQ
jgi:hypothetical protein